MKNIFARSKSQLFISIAAMLAIPITLAGGMAYLQLSLSNKNNSPLFLFFARRAWLYIPLIVILFHLLRRAIWSLDRVTIDSSGVQVTRFGSACQSFSWAQIQEHGIIRPFHGTSQEATVLYFSKRQLTDEERIDLSIRSSSFVAPPPNNDSIILLSCVVGNSFHLHLNQHMLALIPSSPLQHKGIEREWLEYRCFYTQNLKAIRYIDYGTSKILDKYLEKTIIRNAFIMEVIVLCFFVIAVLFETF